MNRLLLSRITGIVFILFAVSVNIPYWLLTQTFEYDDILRQLTEYILTCLIVQSGQFNTSLALIATLKPDKYPSIISGKDFTNCKRSSLVLPDCSLTLKTSSLEIEDKLTVG